MPHRRMTLPWCVRCDNIWLPELRPGKQRRIVPLLCPGCRQYWDRPAKGKEPRHDRYKRVWVCVCGRCKSIWYNPDKDSKPTKRCRSCKSPYWNKKRVLPFYVYTPLTASDILDVFKDVKKGKS